MNLKLFTALIILLVLGDCLSTYLVLTQIPGGEEMNPLVVPVINSLGIIPAMLLSVVFRIASIIWMYALAKTGETRKIIILIGFGIGITLTLLANINNWVLWLNYAA